MNRAGPPAARPARVGLAGPARASAPAGRATAPHRPTRTGPGRPYPHTGGYMSPQIGLIQGSFN
ncbi:hypothetical protein AB0R11_22830, partial [Streptomyces fradiae]